MIESREQNSNVHTPLLNSIKNIVQRDCHVSIGHIYCEANFAADFLAKNAGSLPVGYHVAQEPLASLGTIGSLMICMGLLFLVR